MKNLLRFVGCFILILMLPATAIAAIWDGGGGDGLASNPLNWTVNMLPLYPDTIVFDATSSIGCTWNLNRTYSALTIAGGYTGTVTLSSTITLSTPTYIPDTGQTACYDSIGNPVTCGGTGQDGAYSINPMSFTDNGDGTITDNVTGLQWQKCTNGLSGSDCSAGTATTSDWATAGTTCSSLELNGMGWRLPADLELLTIINYGTYYPAIDASYFPNTQTGHYWSSTTNAGNANNADVFEFLYGQAYDQSKANTGFYARCVRGKEAAFARDFTDNGDGTITDNVTGLLWQKCSSGQTNDATCSGTATQRTWDVALSDCEALSLGGFTDWRLPNIRELKSISDSTIWPTLNGTYFPNSPQSQWWSSTTFSGLLAYAWYVNFGYGGGAAGISKSTPYYVRCVRGLIPLD